MSDKPSSQQKAPLNPHILPLYAALPASQQTKVFQAPPEGHRQIILATNVAETSLTIPGIRYVIDCGRSKEKVFAPATGIQSFETQWISKASASQRTGRAGRTGPGHCWRLYSSAVYEQFFAEHAEPEILRTPLEGVVLQLKGFNVESVPNFPFPTPPERAQLVAAEQLLLNLGAVDERGISKVGEELARLPVNPRYGTMLLKARETGVLAYVVALVAALAVGELFIPEPQTSSLGEEDEDDEDNPDDAQRTRHQAYTRAHAHLASLDPRSDAIKLLTALIMHAESSAKKRDGGESFSRTFFLRQKGMQEAQLLRQQLWSLLGTPDTFDPVLPPPTDAQLGLVRQAAARGFVECVAIRADLLPGATTFGRKPRRAGEVAYRTLIPLDRAEEKATQDPSAAELLRSVFVHPSSVLARLSVQEMPAYIAYTHLSQARGGARTRMHPLTALGPKTLAFVAEGTPLVRFGTPVAGRGVVESEGGRRRECWVPVSVCGVVGGEEWGVDCWRVVTKRGGRGNWKVERVLEYGGGGKR